MTSVIDRADDERMPAGDNSERRSDVTVRRIATMRISCALLFAITCASEAFAATACDLPAKLGIVAEQHGTIGGSRVVVATGGGESAELRPGDVIRQANGTRVERCVDLESAAAEAVAKGVRLLLLIERDGGVEALASVPKRDTPAAETASAPAAPEPPALGSDVGMAAPEPHRGAPAERRVTRSAPAAKPVRSARVETTLPARDDASPATIAAATAALGSLHVLDSAARAAMPMVLYEQRLNEAETAIGALSFPDDPAAARVRAAINEILAYHRTARDIWRTRVDDARSNRTERLMVGGQPYFSDSQVPEWVAEYPFLQATLLSSPRENSFLPGETSGSWHPERAVELLWARGHEATERLSAWLVGG